MSRLFTFKSHKLLTSKRTRTNKTLQSLILLFCFLLFGITRVEATTFTDASTGVTYTISIATGYLTNVQLTKCPTAFSGSFTIPGTVINNSTTYNVTSIASNVFLNCTAITSVTLPSTLNGNGFNSRMGTYAFSGCTALKTAIINTSLTSLAEGAFKNCQNLISVNIPSTTTKIQSYAFINCGSLTSIVIPDAVTEIQREAFEACQNLKTITLGSGMKTIGTKAFYSCIALTSVYTSSSSVPTSIATDAFTSTPSSKVLYILDGGANTNYNTHSATTALWTTTAAFSNFKHYWKPTISSDLLYSSKYLATLYLGYNAAIPTGVTVYTAAWNAGKTKLNLTDITSSGVVPANTGVIIAGNASTYQFDETSNTSSNTSVLLGSCSNLTVTANSCYVLDQPTGYNVGFYKYPSTTLLANKAYLTKTSGSNAYEFDEATGIKNVIETTTDNGLYFNLQGQRINNPQRGIFIHNGKKVSINK